MEIRAEQDARWGSIARRFGAIGPVMKAAHDDAAPGPHWYLNCLAVAPGAQGRGAGGQLLSTLGVLADRDGVPIYLEV